MISPFSALQQTLSAVALTHLPLTCTCLPTTDSFSSPPTFSVMPSQTAAVSLLTPTCIPRHDLPFSCTTQTRHGVGRPPPHGLPHVLAATGGGGGATHGAE